MKVSRKKIIIGAVIVVALVAIVVANLTFKRSNAVTINVEPIKKQRLEAIVSASGTIQPKRSVNISADTMGRVTSLAVNEGDGVKQGQFLLQIDPRNLRSRVDSGEASMQASASQLEQAKVQIESSRTALLLAQENVRRQRELWKQGLTTKETLDRTENETKLREIELQERIKAVETLRLRVQQERAMLEGARYDLSKVRIESPINGLVTRRNIEEGETVVIGTMNNPGTVLLTIADMSIIEAEVEVDETDIPSVKIGQKAVIRIDAAPNQSFNGKVTEVGNSPIQATGQAAAGQQATNFKVVVTLEGEIPDVRPGFTCTAEITTATRETALSVPIQALAVRELVFDEKGQIVRPPKEEGRRPRRPSLSGAASAEELPKGQTRKEEEGVFVVRNNVAEFVPVKTGIAGEKYFELLSGPKEGEQVIIGPFSSVRNLQDGDPVKVETPDKGTRRR
ncbi:MAG TPA: efflux RND transporter periplasmic adaptor subunit [Vicinamibacterales bacterium]|jgi:HlyD family secretion protein|nr:efflux RND transporter periplasmic adaptor subunit [Vicinamibacterales bacterium]